MPTQYSMQLFVVAWQKDHWEVTALQNARVLSLDTAMALDSLAATG